MAIKHFCDGCNTMIEGTPVQLGYVIERDYCNKCGANAETFLAEMDTVHEEAAKVFEEGVAEARRKWSQTLNSLPDYDGPEDEE